MQVEPEMLRKEPRFLWKCHYHRWPVLNAVTFILDLFNWPAQEFSVTVSMQGILIEDPYLRVTAPNERSSTRVSSWKAPRSSKFVPWGSVAQVVSLRGPLRRGPLGQLLSIDLVDGSSLGLSTGHLQRCFDPERTSEAGQRCAALRRCLDLARRQDAVPSDDVASGGGPTPG